MEQILVTGATGQFGKAAIDFLLKKGIAPDNITALVRDEVKATYLKEKGVQIKIGDYNKSSSLDDAFRGITKLLFISTNDIMNRRHQHQNVVNAAMRQHVKHIVYTSFDRKNEANSSPVAFSNDSHIATELMIKNSKIPYTIMRNNLYMDYLLLFMGQQFQQTGIYFPAGVANGSYATRNDMAEAAANVITEKGHESKEYVIANNEAISFPQLADLLTEIIGTKINYESPDLEGYKSALSNSGIPGDYINAFAAFAEAIKQGEFDVQNNTLEKLLGRKPQNASQFFKTIFKN